MAILVSSAKTSLENRKRDISDVSDSVFIEWCNFINDFYYRTVNGIDPGRNLTTDTISVVSGTETYALPSDFNNMQVVGSGLYDLDGNSDPIESSRLTLTGYGAAVNGYYISGSNVVLTPQPSATNTLTIRYIPDLTALTATSNSLQIPDEYRLYVINAIDVLYTLWDEDKNSEVFADARFSRSLDELAKNINQQPMISSMLNINPY